MDPYNPSIFRKSKYFYILLILILIAFILLSGCGNSLHEQANTSLPMQSNPDTALPPNSTPTSDLQFQKSTSTSIVPYETQTATPGWYLEAMHKYTQEPVRITTHEAANNKYIYKYADVTFIVPFRDESMTRLNLDNLDDNSFENSDVLINHRTGSGGTFIDFYPLNSTLYYFSDLHSMSYDSCMEHFPFTNMDPDIYSDQSWRAGSQRDFCILTDEGHLSIMRYVGDIFLPDDWEHVYLELVVTTYRQIVPQGLTPLPTYTPGPSPTPNRYTGMNLTQKQELALDKAAQAFLDAVASYDKEKVADLMIYPLALDYRGYKYLDYAKNREEFLSAYDGIFSQNLVEELKQATLEENMGIHLGNSLSLVTRNCAIFFYPDGKIHEISRSSVWLEP